MSAVPLIVAALQGQPSVTTLLAAGKDGVHAIAAPQKAPRPSVIVVPLSETEAANLAGRHDGIAEARFVVIVRGNTATEILTTGDAVIRALKDQQQSAGQRFQILRENVDTAEQEAETLFRRTVGFRIHYST